MSVLDPPDWLDDIPDSGDRVGGEDGAAVRESPEQKCRVDGISPLALMRVGWWFTAGGKKYGDFRNWERGMPWMAMYGSMFRHMLKWSLRDRSEDHLAAIAWNALALLHYDESGTGTDDRPPTWRAEPEPQTEWMGFPVETDESLEPGQIAISVPQDDGTHLRVTLENVGPWGPPTIETPPEEGSQ